MWAVGWNIAQFSTKLRILTKSLAGEGEYPFCEVDGGPGRGGGIHEKNQVSDWAADDYQRKVGIFFSVGDTVHKNL